MVGLERDGRWRNGNIKKKRLKIPEIKFQNNKVLLNDYEVTKVRILSPSSNSPKYCEFT